MNTYLTDEELDDLYDMYMPLSQEGIQQLDHEFSVMEIHEHRIDRYLVYLICSLQQKEKFKHRQPFLEKLKSEFGEKLFKNL